MNPANVAVTCLFTIFSLAMGLVVIGETAQGAREHKAAVKMAEKQGSAKLNGMIFRVQLASAAK